MSNVVIRRIVVRDVIFSQREIWVTFNCGHVQALFDQKALRYMRTPSNVKVCEVCSLWANREPHLSDYRIGKITILSNAPRVLRRSPHLS